MKKLLLILPIISILLLAFAGGSGKKVAIVKISKGKAIIISADGVKTPVKKGIWVSQGSVVKTESRSFVKLSFIDKSTMNVGPNSEMKIEKFSKNEAGVINVLSGKIRSKVSKDYLKMEKDKSKLFVKSKSAVMGIRGTDFAFATNRRTGASTAVLFEGSVVFNKINSKNKQLNLESIVNQGHRIKPGQFSIVRADLNRPTIPAKMSLKQIRKLEKNETFISKTKPNKNESNRKSIVPPGLSGEIVSNDGGSLEQGIKKVVKINIKKKEIKLDEQMKKESKGFVSGDLVKPADGAIVHIDSGTVIPMGNDATFDKNTGEWKSNSIGSVDDSGGYVPPPSYKITDEGKLLKEIGGTVHIVNTDIRPIDQVAPLDMIETKIYKEAPIVGPAPAGESSVVEPISTEKDESACVGCLPSPPKPLGDIRPSTYSEGSIGIPGRTEPPKAGKTRANISVTRGN